MSREALVRGSPRTGSYGRGTMASTGNIFPCNWSCQSPAEGRFLLLRSDLDDADWRLPMRDLLTRTVVLTTTLVLVALGLGAVSPVLGANCGDGVGPCHCG